jgi:hypothetical protein
VARCVFANGQRGRPLNSVVRHLLKAPPMKLVTMFRLAFGVAVVPMFFVARYGENHWGFDSIGTWYTVFCAASFALVIAGIVVGCAAVLRVIRRPQLKDRGNGHATDA